MNPQEDTLLPLDECPATPPGEQILVLAEDLIHVLKPILDRQKREYEDLDATRWSHHSLPSPYGPMTRLEDESGIQARAIFRILNGESCSVTLDMADKLCLAFGLNISYILPDEAFYSAAEVRAAVKMQSELVRTIARCHGIYIPPAGGNRQGRVPTQVIPRIRKQLLAKAA